MPIEYHFPIPSSAQDLPVPTGPASKLFVCFISSTDPATNLPWCPDVRAALPRLEKTFSSHDAAQLAYVHVGQKPEWKELDNVYRKVWGISAIPTLVKYQNIDDEVVATGKLVEGEIMDERKLAKFCGE